MNSAANEVDALDALPLDDSSGTNEFFDARDAFGSSSDDSL